MTVNRKRERDEILENPKNIEEMKKKLLKDSPSIEDTPAARQAAMNSIWKGMALHPHVKVEGGVKTSPDSPEVKHDVSAITQAFTEEQLKIVDAANKRFGGNLPKDIIPPTSKGG